MSSTRKPTVIIVDDDPSVRRALRMQLGIAGYKVRVFESAENFLAGTVASANACLLLDIYMPGMSGIELWEHLAADGRQMPTVFMSGRDEEVTRKLAQRARGVPCLFKPFDESTLLRGIRKAMHGQPQLRC